MAMPARPDPAITPELRTWLSGAGLAVKGSYRIDEVMALLDCGRNTVYTLISRGDLDVLAINTGGQRIRPTRIPLPSLARLLDPPTR